MDYNELTKLIREKLHVKRGDILPFTGWVRTVDRIGLIDIFRDAGFKVGAEIGVRKGDYSKQLCEKIPGLKLFCIDPYKPFEGGRPSQGRQDAYYEIAKNRLKGFDVHFIIDTSIGAVQSFKNGELDFVYIDAMHDFDNVMTDIIVWSRKVRNGGIVSGHDYYENANLGVVDAVRSYTHAHLINDWYITTGREAPICSWFWIKR